MAKKETKIDEKPAWYVETRSSVKGPVTLRRIVDETLAGRVKVIYRISRDKQNWKAICNETAVEEFVQSEIKRLAQEATRYEDEKTVTVSDKTGFANLTKIQKGISQQLEHAETLQEINHKLTLTRDLLAEILTRRKMVVEIKPRIVEELHPDDRNVYITPKTFWQKISWRDRQFQTNAGIVFVAVIFVYIFISKGIAKLHEPALPKQANAAQSNAAQSNTGKAIVQQAYQQANQQTNATAGADPTFVTWHNSAAADLRQHGWTNAEGLLLKAMQLGYPEKGTALIMLTIAVENTRPLTAEHLRLLHGWLDGFSEPTTYTMALLVQKILVATQLGLYGEAHRWIHEFVEQSADGKFIGVAPAGLDTSIANAQVLYSWCAGLYQEHKRSSDYNAFMSTCTLKTRGARAALPFAQYAVALKPNVSTNRGLLGYLWTQLDNIPRAKAALLIGPRLTAQSELWSTAVDKICELQPKTENCNLASDPKYATQYVNKRHRRRPASYPKSYSNSYRR